ncbi:MAG: hypothetical protein RIQ99_185, partial [Pseudomonadota bacterium]
VVQRVRGWLQELDPVVFAWSWEAIAGLQYGERLREIAMPALLLRGTEDAAGRAMPEMARLMQRGHFLEIEGGGHMVPMEQPEAVADLDKGVRGREGLNTGDTEHGIWTAGMIQGLIHDIPTCQELVSRIVGDAEQIIRGRLASKLA